MKRLWLGSTLLLCAVLILSACSSVTYPKYPGKPLIISIPGMEKQVIQGSSSEGPSYTTATLPIKQLEIKVLGPVTVEADGIYKFLVLFESGDNGYAKLFAEAKKKYPEMDALVNIMEDTRRKEYLWFLYWSETRILTATAIKYVR